MTSHKCFISFKTENMDYKEKLEKLKIDMIDKSLKTPINSKDQDYIMRVIRRDYLQDSTVTIHLIGQHSAENSRDEFGRQEDQYYIKKELQASLYNSDLSHKSGILGVVLPEMNPQVFQGSYKCSICGNQHNKVMIDDNSVVKEFSYNYYIPKDSGCAWRENDRYCVLVNWSDFIGSPESFIDQAYQKREDPIANKTKVHP